MISKEKTYRIGDVASTLGLSHRAVRYYEELGLIRPSRTKGGFRVYSGRDLDLVRMVMRFKELGMSLGEIHALLKPHENGGSQEAMRGLKESLRLRRDEFNSMVEKYREGIDQIDEALNLLSQCDTCGAQSEMESCQSCIKNNGETVSPLIGQLL